MIHNLDRNLSNFEMYFREYPDWNKLVIYILAQFKVPILWIFEN